MRRCRKAIVTDHKLQHQTLRQVRGDLGAEMEAKIALTVEQISTVVMFLFPDRMSVLRDNLCAFQHASRLLFTGFLEYSDGLRCA